MTRKEEVIKEIESVTIEIDSVFKEYGNFCYEFYNKVENNWIGTVEPLTDEMILADNSMSEEEKEQALYFNSIPKDWDSIHKKYSTQISSLSERLNSLQEELKLINYNEEMDIALSSLKNQ
jgi:hypothetical protein